MAKVKQADMVKHFESLVAGKAIYLWGANCEIITADLCKRLSNLYKSATYNKTYYSNKFKEGKGRIGADCSGAFFAMSKKDDTAKGYYNKCSRKGSISNIPVGEVVAVFNSKLTHIGLYCGNGYTIEMKSSVDNVHKEKLNKNRWAYYGYLDFVDYSTPYVSTKASADAGNTVTVANNYIASYQKWLNTNYNAGLTVDGVYGKKTYEAAVKSIQTVYNEYLKKNKKKLLVVDGEYGPSTKSAAPAYKAIIKEPACVYGAIMKIYGRHKLSAAECVENGNINYAWNFNTQDVIARYQGSTRGLSVDGKLGPSTMNMLFGSY